MKNNQLHALVKELVTESFKTLQTKLQKQGKSKAAATKIAGAIAAKKMHGAGKGPTAKQQARMDEKLKPAMGAGEYVKDFSKSKAPQFKGKSKEKKQKMAVAAYLSAKNKK
jgi:hypothetical protein